MTSGPPPTRQCLISDLPTQILGQKVRFLGCVRSYTVATATLALQHKFPITSSVEALVDLKLLLGKLPFNVTNRGTWVNVLGYMVASEQPPQHHPNNETPIQVRVQATVVWPTGPLDISKYAQAIMTARDVEGKNSKTTDNSPSGLVMKFAGNG